MTTPNEKARCRCHCGYLCGGPGVCKLPVMECLQQKTGHFQRDCGHEFNEWREEEWGGTMVCVHCGMSAMGHDSMVGP